MKRVIVLTLALLMVISAMALAEGVGAFSAFDSGIGARALAMGGAFVAVANDATAAYWNPAGLAGLTDTRLDGMSTDLFGWGITHQFVGATTNLAGFGFGVAWERDSVLGTGATSTGGSAGTFTWSESAIIGSIAANLFDVAHAGVNVKYYMADDGLGDTANGFGFDLGLVAKLGDMFSIGAVARDLGGTAITWSTGTTNTVDAGYTAGLAMMLLDGNLTLAADIDFDGMQLGDTHVGLEFKVIKELALRGGLVLADNFQSYYFSVGAGISVAGLSVDAAYLMNETIGDTLVLSAEFSLGSLLGGTPATTSSSTSETPTTGQ